MSRVDEALALYPHYRRRLEHLEPLLRQAELVILTLRHQLRDYDPRLPIEYDGTAWAPLEAAWKKAHDGH
jgi:hypothetical protein